MRLRLIPKQSSFFDMFERSAESLVTGARLLAEVLEQGADRKAVARRMRDAEHEADECTHMIYREMNATFVTPFDREDIYRLAHTLDDVMDAMEAAVDLIYLYQVEEIPDEIVEVAELLDQAAALCVRFMPKLRSMNGLQEYFIEANRLEGDADRIYRRLLAKLFTGEYKALEVMKLKDVADRLETAADAFESVAHTIESIAAKQS